VRCRPYSHQALQVLRMRPVDQIGAGAHPTDGAATGFRNNAIDGSINMPSITGPGPPTNCYQPANEATMSAAEAVWAEANPVPAHKLIPCGPRPWPLPGGSVTSYSRSPDVAAAMSGI